MLDTTPITTEITRLISTGTTEEALLAAVSYLRLAVERSGSGDVSLPVGFQIVGRHLDEALVLRAGHAFQQASHRRRPPLV